MTNDPDKARPTRPTRPAKSGKGSEREETKRKAATRRRQADKPRRDWEKQLKALDAEVRSQLAIGPSDVIPSDQMVGEVLLLADPRSFQHLDAVIPAGRLDLARIWITARLAGAGATAEETRVLAESLTPLPDEHLYLHHVDPKTGKAKYKADGALYTDPNTGRVSYQQKFAEEVEKALRSYLNRQVRAQDKPGGSTSR